VSVSVVLVTYNSGEWIDACLASLRRQTHDALDVVVVDNGSPVDPVDAVRRAHPEARYVRQPAGRSFASALNAGAAVATGSALLFLNPDVELEPDAIAQMVARLSTRPRVGAVAAKLRFHWAPAFLNGLGNRVEARSWGSDNAIGHLDLGQFDDRLLVPSACFAAALIPRDAWMAVGPVDEGYPMYYEDVAWCYRARRLGFDIVSAPDAVVYHAFGSRLASGDEPGLTPRKLAHVVYGRVRFASTALGGPTGRRFRDAYLREDLANVRALAKRGNLASVRAYARAWLRVAAHAWSWRGLMATLDDAPVTAEEVVEADARWPDGLTWNGVPELTLPIVRDVYLPVLAAGRTRPLPEWT
jgi:GT2 family glycosyltransferase